MADETKAHYGNLTLLEVIIGVLLLGTAGFFLVRTLHAAKVREQTRAIIEAMNTHDMATV
jgi:hypothetical protein